MFDRSAIRRLALFLTAAVAAWLAIYFYCVSRMSKPACKYLPSHIKFHSLNFEEGLCAVGDIRNNKFGFIDRCGNMVIDCKYDGYCEPEKGLIQVVQDGKAGCIDRNGKVLIPFVYDSSFNIKFGKYFSRACRKNRLGLINGRFKEIIPCLYQNKGYNGTDEFAYSPYNGYDGKIGTFEPLRYLHFLQDNAITLDFEGMKLRLPHPAAYAIHKFIIFKRRPKPDKQERDIEGALRVFRQLLKENQRKEILQIFCRKPKKWQATVIRNLKSVGEEEIADLLNKGRTKKF